MKVADFFCGAGGFSEGFRQAGFEVVFALDKWKPAVETHSANHPESKTYIADIEKIADLPDDEFEELIPDTEVIIGSPPCVAFSNSNKSGKADKELAVRLVEAYLKIVARKKFKKGSILKYWILENVPNAKKYIERNYTASDLNMIGDFTLNVFNESSKVYNSKYFGVASNRTRFICGEFPEPHPTHNEENIISLKYILQKLEEVNGDNEISDPNYNYKMNFREVTDFNYVYEIPEFEWKKAKRQKQDKGYMGKMSFPENMEKPARTVMATMSASSRESMIFPLNPEGYRLPTVREIASIMSFPLEYIFHGSSISVKHRLVGNAVPPKFSFALAKAILLKEKLPIPEKYLHLNKVLPTDFINLNGNKFELKKEKEKRLNAKYKYHIPYLISKAFRVELTNYKSIFPNQICWEAEIHKSQGKTAKVYKPLVEHIKLDDTIKKEVELFVAELSSCIKNFEQLQKAFILTETDRKKAGLLGPDEILLRVRHFLDSISNSYLDKEIQLDDSPFQLPYKIALGYYILTLIINRVGEKE